MNEIIYLSLGSNLGDREAHLRKATDGLVHLLGLKLVVESSIYHSVPVDCRVDCPEFLNKVLKLECSLRPPQLLDSTERLEVELGRTLKGFNVDRVIDIDIILFGNRMFKNERLEIPHPRMCQRGFVLIPLTEIEPDIVDPKTGKPFKEMIPALGDQGVFKFKERTSA